MKKFKNSKYRNTGFIFEVLIRNVTSETLNNQASKSLDIIKKFFRKDSELLKEYKLYQALSESGKKENISDKLIDAVKEISKKIDTDKLKTEKYKLIGELNSKYNIKEFFSTRVDKYPVYASIFKILSYNLNDNPEEYLDNHQKIREYITSKATIPSASYEDTLINENIKTKDEGKFLLKTILNKFNHKYSVLLPEQKHILSKYINENTATESFLRFIQLEANRLKSRLTHASKRVTDPVQKIKITELSKLLENVELAKRIKDDHVSALLKYCELIHLLENK